MRFGIPQSLENYGKLRQLVDKLEFAKEIGVKTYKSYRMYFCNEYTGQLNKFGGLPTHLPPVWPQYGEDDLTFLCQLYCDTEKLAIENTLCIQLYQWVGADGEDGCDIMVVMVPVGAKENLQGEGLSHPCLQEGDITFEEVLEEVVEEHADSTLEDEKGLYLWDSKLKGWFREDNITPDNFLCMIQDGDEHIPIKGSSPFFWGCGYNLVFYLNKEGKVAWDFY